MAWPDSTELLAPLGPWFERTRRELPWRAADLDGPHPDPYAVLVSELMLQQTQVATVIPFFLRWMARFPDAAALAQAADDEIHKLWEGLGYYRRARLLQAAARGIAAEGWPRDLEGLLRLPGLGAYTGAAVASIAFQIPAPALDGNAFRVLSRLLGIEDDPRKAASKLRAWLVPGLETHGPSRLTQAIMELGALVCATSPRCTDCPLADRCAALERNATDRIPVRQARPKPQELELWLLAVSFQGRWLLHPPAARGLLAGLWRWPALPAEATLSKAAEESAPYGSTAHRAWPGWTQVYSHRREHVLPLAIALEGPPTLPEGLVWIEEERLTALPMGRRDGRLRELLSTSGTPSEEAPPVARLLGRLGLIL